jgi:uncharacterized protein
MTVQTSPDRVDSFVAEWEVWHRDHEIRRADPHGFLAISGLHWLSREPQRFDDAAGTWSTGPDGVTVRLDADEVVSVDGTTIEGTHCFGVIPERGGINARWGDVVLEVAKRGGHDILRPRHPDNPLRMAYRATPAYAPDQHWVIPGRYVAFDHPRSTTVGAAVEGLEHVYDAPGRIEFVLDAQRLALTAFRGHTARSLLVLFTDATSGVTTYGAVRSLSVDEPGDNGVVRLDFNRATNLPCAYTELATCPLPPVENRLIVPIQAGERFPFETVT